MADAADIAPTDPRPRWAAYGVTVLMVAAAAWLAVLAEHMTGAANASLIFVLPVVIAAVGYGWGPSLLAAAGGAAAFNFLLIAPRHSFRIADQSSVWSLALLTVVAAIVCTVAAQSRHRALVAAERADQADAVHDLARALTGAVGRAAIADAAARALSRLFHCPAVVMLDGEDGLEPFGLEGAALSPADREAAGWAAASELHTRAGDYPVAQAAFDFWPLVTATRARAAVGLRLADLDRPRPERADPLVGIVTSYLAEALARDAYAARATATQVEIERERLRADLLAAVSHDLKTPLSTILLSLQSLQRFADVHDAAARRDLLALAESQTAMLSGLVGNLLDMSRLDAGAVVVRPAAVAVDDLIAAARQRVAATLAGHPVTAAVPDDMPLVWADATLLESALANILENAGKYAPAGSPITIRALCDASRAVIEVADQGPGFPGAVEPLFAKFARGVAGDGRPPGVGLGLSIARGFMTAQGGRVDAANRDDGAGALVRLVMPLAPG